MVNCSNCGQGLKNVFYYKGKPYGCECFKHVSGMSVETYRRMERQEKQEQVFKSIVNSYPVMFVILDKEVNTKELKKNGYQYRAEFWVGFTQLDNYNTIALDTKEFLKDIINGLYIVDLEKIKEIINTKNLKIEVLYNNELEEINYNIISKNGTFTADEYLNFENTKGIKGIRKLIEEVEENIDYMEFIYKYKIN